MTFLPFACILGTITGRPKAKSSSSACLLSTNCFLAAAAATATAVSGSGGGGIAVAATTVAPVAVTANFVTKNNKSEVSESSVVQLNKNPTTLYTQSCESVGNSIRFPEVKVVSVS